MHWHRHHTAVCARCCDFAQPIFRIRWKIRYLLYGIAENRATRCKAPRRRQGEPASHTVDSLRSRPMRGRKVDELTIKPENIAEFGLAELRSAPRDHIEHRVDICRRAADDTEHFACGGLIFKRLLQLPRPRLLGFEQPGVLDGDDGLMREGGNDFNFTDGERQHLTTPER